MSVFNQCTFIGHAGADAKLLTTSAGKQFLKFRTGVSDYSKKEEDNGGIDSRFMANHALPGSGTST